MRRERIFSFVVLPTLLFATLLCGALAAHKAQAAAYEPGRIRVLAVIGGKSVTDRQVAIDSFIENPGLYDGSGRLSANDIDKGLLRVLTQIMVIEEGRIIGSEPVDPKKKEAQFEALKRKFGSKWKPFLLGFELTENDVRDKIEQKLQVERALNLRVESALVGSSSSDPKGQATARKAVEDWLKQLRSRYRTQLFRYPDDSKTL